MLYSTFVQRKFREADEEESYFNEDDDDEAEGPNPAPPEQKLPTMTSDHEVASLMDDVKSLDQWREKNKR